jgi:hypothetical protein
MPQNTNRRLFYAVQAVGIAPCGTNTFVTVHGLQSVGMNTKLNIEQVFELGQLPLYQNIEELPDVEMTLEKVLDGTAPLYSLATTPATSKTLLSRANNRCTVALSLYSDLQAASSGVPVRQAVCSGLYVGNWSVNVQIDGNATEQLTLQGNNKTWLDAGFTFAPTAFLSTDVPLAATGVNRRQHFVMASGVFPGDIYGITANANPTSPNNDGGYQVKFQSVKVSTTIGRGALRELGLRAAYFRYAEFPVEVRTDYEVLATDGDHFTATEVGALGNGNNTADQPILFFMQEGMKVDCGTQNRCTGVNFGGGNAGARNGNATITYSYVTFNNLNITHPQDPSFATVGW